MSSQRRECAEEATLAELRALVTTAEDGRVAVLRDDELVGVVSRADLLRALEGGPAQPVRGRARASPRSCRSSPRLRRIVDAVAGSASAPTASTSSAARSATSCSARRASTSTSPSRATRSRSPTRSPGARRSGDAASEVRHRGRVLRRRRARRRRHHAHGVLRRARGAADRRARGDPRGSLPPRLHDQRDGRVARRRTTSAGWSIRSAAARPRRARAPRPPQPLVHRRPDADLPRRSATRPGTGFASTSTRRGCCAGASRWGSSATSRRRDCATSWSRCSRTRERRAGIQRLGELGADRAIHPHLRGDEDAAALFARASELRDELGVDVPTLAHRDGGARARLTPTRRTTGSSGSRCAAATWSASSARSRWRRASSSASARSRSTRLRSSRSPTRSRRTRRCSRSRLTTDPSCASTSTRLRDVRLEIGGADLIELGLAESPRVGEILAEIRRRKLNGEIDGREAELEAARELVAAGAPA